MFALGAMLCAHSTSSDSSTDQSSPAGELPGNAVVPFSFSTVNVGPPDELNCGSPNAVLNALASVMIVGSLKASTMAMVWPAPLSGSKLRPYAARICVGLIGAVTTDGFCGAATTPKLLVSVLATVAWAAETNPCVRAAF